MAQLNEKLSQVFAGAAAVNNLATASQMPFVAPLPLSAMAGTILPFTERGHVPAVSRVGGNVLFYVLP
jgi:hypothetical protein